LLQGSHARLDGPLAGETYVAGLDFAGEAAEGGKEAAHDSTVLTIARVIEARADDALGEAQVEVVRHYAWTGAAHAVLYGALVSLLRETWRVQRVAVDATGLGEPLAAFLTKALGPSCVEAVKLSAETKSRMGYALLTAVNSGRFRLPARDGSAESAECWRQVQLCRAVYRPNRTLSYFVEARDGHDDYVMSLALVAAAAAGVSPRRARGRNRDEEPLSVLGGTSW
jgi:phage FluMu gp28-like protein